MMSVSDAVEWVIGHVIVLTCGMKKADAGLHHPGGGGPGLGHAPEIDDHVLGTDVAEVGHEVAHVTEDVEADLDPAVVVGAAAEIAADAADHVVVAAADLAAEVAAGHVVAAEAGT